MEFRRGVFREVRHGVLSQVFLIAPLLIYPGVPSQVLEGGSPLGVPAEFPLSFLPKVPQGVTSEVPLVVPLEVHSGISPGAPLRITTQVPSEASLGVHLGRFL